MIEDNKIDELLNRYMLGEASEHEIQEVLQFLQESPEHQDAFFKMEEALAAVRIQKRMTKYHVEKSWEKVAAQIDVKETTTQKKKMFAFQRVAAYAASVVVLVMAGLAFYFLGQDEYGQDIYVSPGDDIRELCLEDGTKVWLNKNTRFAISDDYSSEHRFVKLNGEAYFEVVKNPKSPFTIESELAKVQVFGTKFNMCARDNYEKATVSLISGVVQVSGNNGEGTVLLEPGQKALIDKQKKHIEVIEANTDTSTEWKSDRFFFDQATLEEIVYKLGRHYNCRFVLDETIGEETYSGALQKTDSLEQALTLLQMVVPFEYNIKSNEVLITKKQAAP